MKRLLLTGPTHGIARYSRAVQGAGWEAIDFPLVRIEHSEIDLAAYLEHPFDLVVVTSLNALPALTAHQADLAATPFAAVGAHTAEALRDLGFTVAVQGDSTAAALAPRIFALRPQPARLLWPRGAAAHELGELLRAANCIVTEVEVYATVPKKPTQLPEAEAIFLASPSAVHALPTLLPSIAIGPTTATAIERVFPNSPRPLVLEKPTPSALAAALARFDP